MVNFHLNVQRKLFQEVNNFQNLLRKKNFSFRRSDLLYKFSDFNDQTCSYFVIVRNAQYNNHPTTWKESNK